MKKNKIHSQSPRGPDLEKELDKIFENPIYLSRWAALIQGIKIIDNHEEKWKLGLKPEEKIDLDQNALVDFVDAKAPDILFEILNKNNQKTLAARG